MSFYNKDKNPMPFYRLEDDVWTNYKPLWFKNNCNGYSNNVYPGLRYYQLHLPDALVNPSQVTAVNLRHVDDNTIFAANINKDVFVGNGKKYLTMSVDLLPAWVGSHFYISVETQFGNFYSETFCLKVQTNEQIAMAWGSDCAIVGNMVYPDLFEHVINIDAKILPLDPQIEEETLEDGFGNETATLQKLSQGYFFSCMVPNFIAQALAALPLHNRFNLINRTLGESENGFDTNITKVTVKVSPEEDGCFSFVEVEVIKENITKTACCDGIFNLQDSIILLRWEDNDGDEDRSCTLAVGTDCSETVKFSSPSGFGYYIQIEESIDDGINWAVIGYGSEGGTHTLNYQTPGRRWVRVMTQYDGGRVYSNILVYEID